MSFDALPFTNLAEGFVWAVRAMFAYVAYRSAVMYRKKQSISGNTGFCSRVAVFLTCVLGLPLAALAFFSIADATLGGSLLPEKGGYSACFWMLVFCSTAALFRPATTL